MYQRFRHRSRTWGLRKLPETSGHHEECGLAIIVIHLPWWDQASSCHDCYADCHCETPTKSFSKRWSRSRSRRRAGSRATWGACLFFWGPSRTPAGLRLPGPVSTFSLTLFMDGIELGMSQHNLGRYPGPPTGDKRLNNVMDSIVSVLTRPMWTILGGLTSPNPKAYRCQAHAESLQIMAWTQIRWVF